MLTVVLFIGFGLGWLGNSYFEDHLAEEELIEFQKPVSSEND